MLKTVYFGLIVLNILSYVWSRKVRKLIEYASEIFVALFIASTRYISGSYIAADQYRYEYTYNNVDALGSYAIGYKLLNYFGNWLNLSFDAFYFIVTIICTIAIYHAVRKLKCNSYIITTIFLLYYIIVAVDLLKNFIAFTILLNVFPYLLSNDKKDKWKYFIGIMVATTFHISFILYLLLLLRHVDFNRFKTSNNWKIAAGGILSFIIMIFIFGGQRIVSVFSNALLSLVLRDEAVLERYSVYTSRTTHLSALAPVFIFIVTLIGLNIWKNRAASTKNMLSESRCIRTNVLNVFFSFDYLSSFCIYVCRIFQNYSRSYSDWRTIFI